MPSPEVARTCPSPARRDLAAGVVARARPRQGWLALGLALLLLPASARAFTREFASAAGGARGPCLFWGTRTIDFVTNEKGSQDAGAGAFDAVKASFEAWAPPLTSCTDLSLDYGGTTARIDVGYSAQQGPRPTLVVWRETTCKAAAPRNAPCLTAGGCNNLYGCWEHDDAIIALTTTSYNTATGEIVHADIEVNGAGFVFTAFDGAACPPYPAPPPSRPSSCVAWDVRNTLTHEVGHLLGLDHSAYASATMYHGADLGEVSKRDLSPDDIEGVCFIYPTGRATSTCLSPPPDPAPAASGCSSGAGSGLTLLCLPFLGALLRRRRHPGCSKA